MEGPLQVTFRGKSLNAVCSSAVSTLCTGGGTFGDIGAVEWEITVLCTLHTLQQLTK
jgi:hypothetical protein